MYSECYTFYKESGQKKGTFFHDSYTDDGGVWKGSGTFTENGVSIKLTYADWTEPVISYAVSEKPADSVKLYWTDTWGETQHWFDINCIDAEGKTVYETITSIDNNYATIPGHYCNPEYHFNIAQYNRVIYSFIISEPTDVVMISVNDTLKLHTFKNPPIVLTKTKKGFIASALWAKGRQRFEVRAPLMPPPDPINNQCIRKSNYSTLELRKRYPFNRASRVKLVAFEARHGKLPLDASGNLKESDCKQIVELSQTQTDSMTDILYNYSYNDSLEISTKTYECYEPRHAIVLYNKSGKLFAYLEICFECRGNTSNIKTADFGDFCDGKYELLEKLFKQSGVTFFAEQDKSSFKQVEEPIIK